MNIDVWKILISYTTILENVKENSSIKSFFKAYMVYTPEVFTGDSTLLTAPSMTVKNYSAGKSLRIFS